MNVTQASHQSLSAAFGSMVHHEQTLTGNEKRRTVFGLFIAVVLLLVAGGLTAWKLRARLPLLASVVVVGLASSVATAIFVALNYIHLFAPTIAPSRLGVGISLQTLVADMTNWFSRTGGERTIEDIITTPVSVTGMAMGMAVSLLSVWLAWHRRSRTWCGVAMLMAAVLAGLCTSDLAFTSPPLGKARSSWVHQLHRSALVWIGLGGQGSQPREIYRSLAAPAVDTVALAALKITSDVDQEDPRVALTAFLAHQDSENRMARNLVNRVWKQIFGIGIVEPADNISFRHPPTDPALLDDLTLRFVENRWSLKWLLGELLGSATYRRSSLRGPVDAWARFSPRSLSGNERFELIRHVTGADASISPHAAPEQASAHQSFVGVRIRSSTDGLLQTLHFFQPSNPEDIPLDTVRMGMENSVIEDMIRNPRGRAAELARLLDDDAGPESVDRLVQRFYLVTMGREPTTEQQDAATTYLHSVGDLPEACSNLVWTILNSEESFLNY